MEYAFNCILFLHRLSMSTRIDLSIFTIVIRELSPLQCLYRNALIFKGEANIALVGGAIKALFGKNNASRGVVCHRFGIFRCDVLRKTYDEFNLCTDAVNLACIVKRNFHNRLAQVFLYMVLCYADANGKRKTKWISTGLPTKGNKKKAEKMLAETRKAFVPENSIPTEQEMLFADFMEQWLEIVKSSIQTVTYSSYSNMVKGVIR